ncbi:unnamed protein product, partial [marine sediment metagenome]
PEKQLKPKEKMFSNPSMAGITLEKENYWKNKKEARKN